jgi:hypothetical protein
MLLEALAPAVAGDRRVPLIRQRRVPCFVYGIAVVALGAAAFAASPASAGGGHHRGHHGGYHHHHHGHHAHRGWHGGHRFHHVHRPIFASCWRWIPTPLGYTKVWICN